MCLGPEIKQNWTIVFRKCVACDHPVVQIIHFQEKCCSIGAIVCSVIVISHSNHTYCTSDLFLFVDSPRTLNFINYSLNTDLPTNKDVMCSSTNSKLYHKLSSVYLCNGIGT